MQPTPKVVLLLENSRAMGRGLLKGISKYAHIHGPWTIYRDPPNYRKLKEFGHSFEQLTGWGADGMVIEKKEDKFPALKAGIPVILAYDDQEAPKDIPVVISDAAKISNLAADHLMERGFNNFAFCGFDDCPWSLRREKFFCESIREKGFDVSVYRTHSKDIKVSWEEEIMALSNWIKNLPFPTGLMACNDDLSRNIVEACRLAFIHVPEQVAVVGVDNDELVCELSDPRLSSVMINFKKAGYEVAKTLDIMMKGEKPHNLKIDALPSHVVVRQSSDIVAIEDQDVADALKFIRKNCSKDINVDNVVQSTCVSRRVLESRFKKTLGRTINNEIRRLRTKHIAKMLLETDLSVANISYSMGFTNHRNISRYFRQVMGISIREYRKKYKNIE